MVGPDDEWLEWLPQPGMSIRTRTAPISIIVLTASRPISARTVLAVARVPVPEGARPKYVGSAAWIRSRTVRIEDIEYEVDGRRMVGMLAVDEYRPGPRPTVLVCHEGPGLEAGVRGRAIRLAALGCCAFALDYQGDGQ